MRILTFGVLIVVVGTFAALPFRRYNTNPQTVPQQATGPTQSTLSGLNSDTPVDDPAAEAELPSLALPRAGNWKTREREIRMPLTYDDLAVPLAPGPSFEKNFPATATAQALSEKTLSRQHTSTAQRLEPAQLATSGQPASTLTSGSGSVLSTNDDNRVTELVSTPVAKPATETLPPTPPKQRHWVRQP